MTGIYVHIPYCVKKCGYCDFYSVCDLSSADLYTDRVCELIKGISEPCDTLYFGGGTPSLLGGDRISKIISAAAAVLTDGAEITVEVNPGDRLADFFGTVAASGVNRVSIGMQSHVDRELTDLTRRHNAHDADVAVNAAHKAGIDNVSLDVMLGIEGQTPDSLSETLRFCRDSGACHVSAYMLKIEDGTPFASGRFVPDDDTLSDLYLQAVDELSSYGFAQYEISNFCRDGKYSRHNIKYWLGDDYIGIGAAAHSFVKGKRSYYPRNIDAFISGTPPISDGEGGGFDETVMLRLRLCSGLDLTDLAKTYPDRISDVQRIEEKARLLVGTDTVKFDQGIVRLTPKGFLVSNEIITEFLV